MGTNAERLGMTQADILDRAEVIAEVVGRITRDIFDTGNGFTKWDDDWSSRIFTDTEVITVTHDGGVIAGFIKNLREKKKPDYIAVVFSGWASTPEAVEIYGRPSLDPDRTERLSLMIGTHEGFVHSQKATINRDGKNPPTLGEFDSAGQHDLQGRLIYALSGGW